MERETRQFAYTRRTERMKDPEELAALAKLPLSRLFHDTGKRSNSPRPQRNLLKLFLQPGDTLTVWKLDRLGFDAPELLKFLQWLAQENIRFVSLTETGSLADFISELKISLLQSDPMTGEGKVSLRHLCELEIRVAKLARALQDSKEHTAEEANALKAMASDMRVHLSFIAQQIRFGEHAAALGRIDEIASDF